MSKVKNKTKKAMKLRFKLTGTGKLLRRKHGKRHILTKKSSKRKRSLSNPVLVATTILSKYKGMMGVA